MAVSGIRRTRGRWAPGTLAALQATAAQWWSRVVPRDRVVLAVLGAGALLRTVLALATPLMYAPDESSHALYVHEAAHGVFPVNSRDWLWATRTGADEFFQPPLYYALAGVLYRILLPHGTAALYSVRLLNVLLGIGVALVTWHICRTAFPTHRRVARAATAIVALLPTVMADSSAINNDVLCTLLMAVTTLVTVRAVRTRNLRRRDAAVIALLVGAALWTKTSAIVMLPVILMAGALPGQARRRNMLNALGACIGGVVLVLPWWVGRNLRSYGNLLAAGTNYPHWHASVGQKVVESASVFARTFFAAFGRVGEIQPFTILSVMLAMVSAACMVYAVALSLRRGGDSARVVAVIAAEAAATIAAAVAYAFDAHQPQGRYLFYALPVLAILIALGGVELLSRVPQPRVPRLRHLGANLAVVYACACVVAALKVFPAVQDLRQVGAPDYSASGIARDPATWVQDRTVPVTR